MISGLVVIASVMMLATAQLQLPAIRPVAVSRLPVPQNLISSTAQLNQRIPVSHGLLNGPVYQVRLPFSRPPGLPRLFHRPPPPSPQRFPTFLYPSHGKPDATTGRFVSEKFPLLNNLNKYQQLPFVVIPVNTLPVGTLESSKLPATPKPVLNSEKTKAPETTYYDIPPNHPVPPLNGPIISKSKFEAHYVSSEPNTVSTVWNGMSLESRNRTGTPSSGSGSQQIKSADSGKIKSSYYDDVKFMRPPPMGEEEYKSHYNDVKFMRPPPVTSEYATNFNKSNAKPESDTSWQSVSLTYTDDEMRKNKLRDELESGPGEYRSSNHLQNDGTVRRPVDERIKYDVKDDVRDYSRVRHNDEYSRYQDDRSSKDEYRNDQYSTIGASQADGIRESGMYNNNQNTKGQIIDHREIPDRGQRERISSAASDRPNQHNSQIHYKDDPGYDRPSNKYSSNAEKYNHDGGDVTYSKARNIGDRQRDTQYEHNLSYRNDNGKKQEDPTSPSTHNDYRYSDREQSTNRKSPPVFDERRPERHHRDDMQSYKNEKPLGREPLYEDEKRKSPNYHDDTPYRSYNHDRGNENRPVYKDERQLVPDNQSPTRNDRSQNKEKSFHHDPSTRHSYRNEQQQSSYKTSVRDAEPYPREDSPRKPGYERDGHSSESRFSPPYPRRENRPEGDLRPRPYENERESGRRPDYNEETQSRSPAQSEQKSNRQYYDNDQRPPPPREAKIMGSDDPNLPLHNKDSHRVSAKKPDHDFDRFRKLPRDEREELQPPRHRSENAPRKYEDQRNEKIPSRHSTVHDMTRPDRSESRPNKNDGSLPPSQARMPSHDEQRVSRHQAEEHPRSQYSSLREKQRPSIHIDKQSRDTNERQSYRMPMDAETPAHRSSKNSMSPQHEDPGSRNRAYGTGERRPQQTADVGLTMDDHYYETLYRDEKRTKVLNEHPRDETRSHPESTGKTSIRHEHGQDRSNRYPETTKSAHQGFPSEVPSRHRDERPVPYDSYDSEQGRERESKPRLVIPPPESSPTETKSELKRRTRKRKPPNSRPDPRSSKLTNRPYEHKNHDSDSTHSSMEAFSDSRHPDRYSSGSEDDSADISRSSSLSRSRYHQPVGQDRGSSRGTRQIIDQEMEMKMLFDEGSATQTQASIYIPSTHYENTENYFETPRSKQETHEPYFIRYGDDDQGYSLPDALNINKINKYGLHERAEELSLRQKRNREYGIDVYAPLISYSSSGQVNEITPAEATVMKSDLEAFFK